MVIIEKGDYLCGIRHWCQHYANRIPHYEVFRYIGTDKNRGLYYFQSVTEKSILSKSFYQLNMGGFKPFVLDYNRITQYLEESNNAPIRT